MIGLGTQQGLGEAEAFFNNFGPFTFPMFWDESGQSWSEIGVAGQPAVAVYGADGVFISKWYGGVDRALDVLQSLSS